MLAITLALLASAQLGTPPIRTQQAPATAGAAAEFAAFVPKMDPNGSAQGVWMSGTLLQDGYLSATLVDSAQQPIYTLHAQVHATGSVSGKLVVLEYASNPALNLPEYSVVGDLKVPGGQRDGVLSLVIFNPLEDFGYVYPRGYIDGALIEGADRLAKPGQVHPQNAEMASKPKPAQGGSSAAETAGIQPQGQIISCPWAPEASNASEVAPATHTLRRSGMIVCPFEPQVTVTGVTSLGAVSAMGHSGASGVKIEVGATALGSTSSASGFQTPALKSGKMIARWTLLL